eukprot:TRINITY_DN3501_c0_g2_i1.p1 TRINITY_DN3501_c0_g2~~TRINITY_DN3501_c0_g2_i1.p1  ORF type:complete len:991 (-),score=180.31 TRINITY_DN3501_c0_g2_i1:339-3311(-)
MAAPPPPPPPPPLQEPRWWWSSLAKECCPISMTTFEELGREPFGLLGGRGDTAEGLWSREAAEALRKAGGVAKAIHWFDGAFLACFMVSGCNFFDPVDRRSLLRTECLSLDRYLAANRLPSVCVTDAYDLTQGGATSSRDVMQAATLRREASRVLRLLFEKRSGQELSDAEEPALFSDSSGALATAPGCVDSGADGGGMQALDFNSAPDDRRLVGHIRTFNAQYGWGFIDSPDSGDLWFTTRDVDAALRQSLCSSVRVSFVLHRGPHYSNFQAKGVQAASAPYGGKKPAVASAGGILATSPGGVLPVNGRAALHTENGVKAPAAMAGCSAAHKPGLNGQSCRSILRPQEIGALVKDIEKILSKRPPPPDMPPPSPKNGVARTRGVNGVAAPDMGQASTAALGSEEHAAVASCNNSSKGMSVSGTQRPSNGSCIRVSACLNGAWHPAVVYSMAGDHVEVFWEAEETKNVLPRSAIRVIDEDATLPGESTLEAEPQHSQQHSLFGSRLLVDTPTVPSTADLASEHSPSCDGLHGDHQHAEVMRNGHRTHSDGVIGKEVEGYIVVYFAEKGYGFISCDDESLRGEHELPEDVFFLAEEMVPSDLKGGSLVGCGVSFELVRSPVDNKPRARRVRKRSDLGPVGKKVEGVVRAHFVEKGYGFIACDDEMLRHRNDPLQCQDVFFPREEVHPDNSKESLVGCAVAFELFRIPSEGKWRARNVQKISDPDGLTPSQAALASTRKEGKIKLYNREKRFGFIFYQGQGNVFFPHDELLPEYEASISVGDAVSFELYRSPHEPTKPRARRVRFEAAAVEGGGLPSPATSPLHQPGPGLPGKVPVLHTGPAHHVVYGNGHDGVNGNGSFHVHDANGGHGNGHANGHTNGHSNGHAHANGHAHVNGRVPLSAHNGGNGYNNSPAVSTGSSIEGRVKSYNAAKGFGFVAAKVPSIAPQGGDFWFPASEVAERYRTNLRPGSLVLFQPRRYADGKLQARQVKPV